MKWLATFDHFRLLLATKRVLGCCNFVMQTGTCRSAEENFLLRRGKSSTPQSRKKPSGPAVN